MTAVRGASLPLASVILYLRGRGLAEFYPEAKLVGGTGSAADIRAVGPGIGAVLSRGGGPGLMAEWAFDQPIVTVRTIGRQNDYDHGEAFAGDVDRWMLADSPIDVGGHRALYVTRAGAAPTLIEVDGARRGHWSCSYVVPVASGL